MKKALLIGLIVLLALAVLATAFVLLYRHFVTGQIMDRGGMENPFLEETQEEETAPSAAVDAAADGTEEKEID